MLQGQIAVTSGRRVRLSASGLAKLALALAVLAAVASRPELKALVDPARVHGWLAQAGPFAPLLLMVLMATAAALFLLLPRWIEKYNLLGLKRFFGHPEGAA